MINKNSNAQVALSADVGGSKTRLQLTTFSSPIDSTVLANEEYLNHEFSQLDDIITAFLTARPAVIDCACIAVAGPVSKGIIQLTNLPWQISKTDLAKRLGLKQIKFINDFEAIGYGAALLPEEDYCVLQEGIPRTQGLQAIIGAGTGLGVALLDTRHELKVFPTEGGHVDFAPSDDLQEDLLVHLRNHFHRVSCERVVSGKGIENIYKYLAQRTEYQGHENAELKRLSHFSPNFAGEIAHFALTENDPIALKTLDTFIRAYGAIAGNLALMSLPFGGLYIAGGIAPKLLALMQDGRFMQAFLDKGRMSELLSELPVKIILNTKVGLIGAAYYAAFLN